MPTLSNVFVVIDPTTDKQLALDNAARIASRSKDISVTVYCAVYNGAETDDWNALKRVEMARHQHWIESLVEPLRSQGNSVDIELEWTSEWRDAIAPAAKSANADLIIKSGHSHTGAGRRILKTSDWTLLRTAECPVYLIKRDSIESGDKVLVALDIAREDALHKSLNDRVLDYGQAVVGAIAGGTLHAVNAYSSSSNFIHPPDLAKAAGVDRAHAHTVEGAPEKVIPEVAEQINAGIVVIGTVARGGIKAAVIGNTAEKMIDAVDTNILVVTAHED